MAKLKDCYNSKPNTVLRFFKFLQKREPIVRLNIKIMNQELNLKHKE